MPGPQTGRYGLYMYGMIGALLIMVAAFRVLGKDLHLEVMTTAGSVKLSLASLVMPLFNIAILDLLVTVMVLEKSSFFKAYFAKRCRSKHAESSNTMNPSNGNDKVAERMLEAQNRLDEHIESQWAEFCDYLQNPEGDNSEAFEHRVSQHLGNLEVLQKLQDRFTIANTSGPASFLHITTIPKPTPSPNSAIVKIRAFGLNRMDLLQREGKYPVPPQAPSTLGVEFSGVIESFGDEVREGGEEGFKVGDEVFGLAYGGAYAEFINVSVHMLIRKPEELGWVEVAGVPETWITATQAMYLIGEYAPGKTILWHAGASSVSIAGIQLSRGDGAGAIYVTAGSQEKIDFCVKELGATAGFNYRTQDWAKEILAATNGKGVDIIVDFVGQNYFQGNLDAAARDGRIVHLGAMSGTKLPAGVDIGAFVRKRVRFEGSSLRSRDEGYQGKLRDTLVEHAVPLLRKGEMKVFVEKVFPWERIVEAHELMESNRTKGKIICTID
ncbi:MAG: hypothetical protein Q9173_005286 [Seirophora scorigena]